MNHSGRDAAADASEESFGVLPGSAFRMATSLVETAAPTALFLDEILRRHGFAEGGRDRFRRRVG